MVAKALPALLITIALLPIIGIVAIIVYLVKRTYRKRHSNAIGDSASLDPNSQDQDPFALSAPSEKYAAPAPGTTYKLQPQRPQAHPSIKRKRALPLVAARTAYALPGASAVVAPTHSGADWTANGAGHRQQQTQQGLGREVEVDANFEEIHLGALESERPDRGRPDSGALGAEERQSLWGQKARRVAERQNSGGGQGLVHDESGGEDGVLVSKREARTAQEEEEDEVTLGSFDFEGEEAGRKRGRTEGKPKEWRLSLFGRSEYAG